MTHRDKILVDALDIFKKGVDSGVQLARLVFLRELQRIDQYDHNERLIELNILLHKYQEDEEWLTKAKVS